MAELEDKHLISTGDNSGVDDVDYNAIICGYGEIRFVCFQTATSAMLGAAVTSAGAVVLGYSSAPLLGPGVCIVAFLNYSAMAATRLRTVKACRKMKRISTCNALKKEDDFVVTCLRYSDWLITMPMLAVEMLSLAQYKPMDGSAGDLPTWLQFDYMFAVVAITSFVMIACGFVSLLAVGDFESCKHDTLKTGMIRWPLLALGTVCLVVLYVILWMTAVYTKTPYLIEVIGFSGVWALYPVVFMMQTRVCVKIRTQHKDIAFAILDTISKALFSVVISIMSGAMN